MLDTGASSPAFGGIERTGRARSLRSLRLPSVARLEFIPTKIGAGMTILIEGTIYTNKLSLECWGLCSPGFTPVFSQIGLLYLRIGQ